MDYMRAHIERVGVSQGKKQYIKNTGLLSLGSLLSSLLALLSSLLLLGSSIFHFFCIEALLPRDRVTGSNTEQFRHLHHAQEGKPFCLTFHIASCNSMECQKSTPTWNELLLLASKKFFLAGSRIEWMNNFSTNLLLLLLVFPRWSWSIANKVRLERSDGWWRKGK